MSPVVAGVLLFLFAVIMGAAFLIWVWTRPEPQPPPDTKITNMSGLGWSYVISTGGQITVGTGYRTRWGAIRAAQAEQRRTQNHEH
jgi:uncharacterized SAM-binding protein YcdF (DUF218 family)